MRPPALTHHGRPTAGQALGCVLQPPEPMQKARCIQMHTCSSMEERDERVTGA